MKKLFNITFFAVALLIFGGRVSAANRLYFTNNGDRLYYDNEKIDDETFMNHQDMLPGKTYTDELIIENGTDTEYVLYFKVKERDQSEELSEFLDHIEMKIYLDDELIYEGYVKGKDYTEEGINLQDAVKLGDAAYKKGEEHKLVVETMLEYDYNDTTERDVSLIDWQFIAEYEEELIPILPNTGDNIITTVIISVVSIMALVFILIVLFRRKESKV